VDEWTVLMSDGNQRDYSKPQVIETVKIPKFLIQISLAAGNTMAIWLQMMHDKCLIADGA
jgi:hypothetical protein